MSLYNPQYKDGQGNVVDLPINAKKLDGYSYNEYSKYYTTNSTTENAFLVTIPYVKALSDGLVIHCQFHAATKSGATLNVNSLGAKGIYYRYATAITTHIVANNYVDLIYSASIDKWVLLFSYDADSNTLGYQVRTNNGAYKNGADTSCFRYQIVVETNDGLEAFTSTSNSTGTSKTQLSPKYIPNGAIRYYSGTSTVASNGKFSATALWQQYQGINLKYSFNISTITTDSPCYIKMSRNTDGTLSPVYSATSGGHPLVFALPTTKDGYYYTYLGRTYTSSSVVYLELELSNPTFYYDGGVRVYDGTYFYDWAKASTKPTYTASEVGALPSTTAYVKSASVSGNTLTITPSSGTALTYTPTIFAFTGVISTQDITIKNLQTGIYLLTFNGTKKIHTAIGEVSNNELVLETSTTYNNILIANRYTVTSGDNTLSFILWKLMCPFSNNILYKGCTYQTEGSSSTIYWTGQVYQERFIEESMYISYNGASSSDEHYYYPLYRDTVVEYDDDSGQTKNTYNLLKTGPKYAGGTAVTLNGTNKGSNTVSFYAPTNVGTNGQFLKSNGNGAPTWTGLSDVATSGSYDDLTDTPTIPTETTVTNWGFTKNVGTVTSVRVQAGTGLSSSTSTASTTTLDTTISIASGYKLLTTSEYNTLNAKQDKISVGTNGQLLSSNGSSLVWTDDNRSLLHHDLGVTIENTTTDNGWSMFNSTYNGFLLKSVRFNADSPSWGVGDFGSGIVFGGGDTKGVVSVAYGTPDIKIAGGNGDYPRWWIGLTGTSGKSYNLDRLNYTPTSAGTYGYSLKSNGGSNAPRWANTAKVQLSGSLNAGVHNNTSITLVITSTSYPLNKGVWRYSGTYGTFLIFAPTAITTQGSPRTAYICGYSTPISNNASFELVEV